jgi:hypothetical protein
MEALPLGPIISGRELPGSHCSRGRECDLRLDHPELGGMAAGRRSVGSKSGRSHWRRACRCRIGDVNRTALAVAGLPPVFIDSLSTGSFYVRSTFLLFPTFLRLT